MTDYSFLHNEEILKTLKNIEKQSGIPEDLAKKIQVMKGDAGKDGSSITAIETKDLDDSVEIKVSFTDRDPQSFTIQKLKGVNGKDGAKGMDGYTPVKGIDYFDGKDGNEGKQGKQGKAGANGKDGKNGSSITWKGAWNSNVSYAVQDAVEYNGSSYIAVNPNKGTLPTGTDWNLMAQKGRDGISRGAATTQSSGTGSAGVSSVVAGTNISVDNTDPAHPVVSSTATGNVVGPSSAADGSIALFDGLTGKLIKSDQNVVVDSNGGITAHGLLINSIDNANGIMGTSDGLDMANNSTGLGNINFSVPTFTPMLGLDEVIDSHITAEQLYAGGSAIFMDAADHKVKVHVNGNATPQTVAYTTDLRSRSVNSISTATTAGATANTDYIYLVSGTTTLTLPTAVGNTNRYTVKNTGSATVTIATTSAQTIDGSSTASLPVQYTSLDLISDGSNWNVI